ncbi:MAG: cupin domain-containing protein [Clostridia bacterium]|nr:cupin domain-containing protein [Clostridia bacterium]
MVTKTVHEHREAMRGGKGSAEMYHVIPKDSSSDTVRLIAEIVLNPLSSIGKHQHVGETEPFYILSGEGLFTVNDEQGVKVGPGDVCLMNSGDWHTIENLSATQELHIMAVIYKA